TNNGVSVLGSNGGTFTNQASVSTGNAFIQVAGDKFDLRAGSTMSTTSDVLLQVNFAGVGMDLGSAVGTTGNHLELWQAELNTITAASLVLFADANVNVSQSITLNQTTQIQSDSGAITESTGGEQPDLIVTNLALLAATGIGSGDDLDVDVNNLAFDNK